MELEAEKPEGQDHEDAELVAKFRRCFRSAKSHSLEWREEARGLYDFEAGRQWAAEDEAKMQAEQRPCVTFNLAAKFIDAVQGLQINNRQDIRFYPRDLGDAKVNEILTGTTAWCRDECSAEDEETDSFRDMVLTGMGWQEIFLETESDPEGRPANERRDPLEMYWDPAARKKNLTDARWVIRIKGMDPSEYEETFGEEPENMPEVAALDGDDTDQSIELITKPEDYDGQDTAEHKRGKVYVADYQYVKMEDRFHVRAEGLGEQTLTPEEWMLLEPRIKEAGVPYQASPAKIRVYYRAWIHGQRVKLRELLPYQHGFTYQAITGKRDRNKNLWFGIGRSIRDPNLWVNKFFSSLLFTLMSNAKGGLMAEEDAFADPRKAEAEWARPNSITFMQPGALRDGKVQEKPQAQYPQGMDRLMQFSMNALPETSGLNVEIMGLADRNQAGVLEAQRKQSAMAIIAWAFDAMKRYYRQAGKIYVSYIQQFMSDGRIIRITGEQGPQYVQLAKDQMAGTYDVIVDEAPTSTNMKERTWAILERLIPQLLQAGVKVPPDVIDFLPIPSDLAQKFKTGMAPSPQEQQMQQQIQDLQKRLQEAEVGKTESEAARNVADAKLKEAQTIKVGAESGAIQAGV